MKGNIPKALIFKKNKKLYFPFKNQRKNLFAHLSLISQC